MQKILVATTNPGKIAELKVMLDKGVAWLSLSDFDGVIEVFEDGQTFAENARKKALGYARQTACWTIADDSGLVIDALDGAPGVKSARFSGEKPDPADRTLIDHRNIKKVLELLNGVPAQKRTARFVCCLALASPEKIIMETTGTVEGIITEQQVGQNGFGYDPIFFVPSINKTMAQLTGCEKNKISHRGNAIRKLVPNLRQLLKDISS